MRKILILKRIFEQKMLTEHEKRFVEYWEKNRDRERKVFRQWLVGLPIGIAVSGAIALSYITGWSKQATMVANTMFNPLVLIIALVIIVSFFAIFSRKHKWDMNEQRYLEFKARQRRDEREKKQPPEEEPGQS